MNYLMLVCSEDAPVPVDADLENAPDIDDWCEQVAAHRIYGYQLAEPATAKTVRVRNGRTIVTDGPYVEAKEFIAGFDLLECADLDAAVTIAAAHPMAHHRMVELRPFPEDVSFDGVQTELTASETEPGQRFMLMVCADGIPESDEVEAELMADSVAWGDELKAAGKMPFGNGLQHPDTATTVRYRSGETILTDGPFVETKEFLAGLCIVRCADIDEAVVIAARMPMAGWHRVEVRGFFAG